MKKYLLSLFVLVAVFSVGFIQKASATCTNGTMNAGGQCEECDPGYTLSSATAASPAQCIEDEVVVDLCTNITGDQSTLSSIPAGYVANAAGSGVCPCDTVAGYTLNFPNGAASPGICVPPAPDLCSNVAGNQTSSTIPTGYTANAAGPGVCPCASGFTLNPAGLCVLPAPDLCPNIDGTQLVVPVGYTLTVATAASPAPAQCIPDLSGEIGKGITPVTSAGGDKRVVKINTNLGPGARATVSIDGAPAVTYTAGPSGTLEIYTSPAEHVVKITATTGTITRIIPAVIVPLSTVTTTQVTETVTKPVVAPKPATPPATTAVTTTIVTTETATTPTLVTSPLKELTGYVESETPAEVATQLAPSPNIFARAWKWLRGLFGVK